MSESTCWGIPLTPAEADAADFLVNVTSSAELNATTLSSTRYADPKFVFWRDAFDSLYDKILSWGYQTGRTPPLLLACILMLYKTAEGRDFFWTDMASELRLEPRFIKLMRAGLLTDELAGWHVVCLALKLPEREGGVYNFERRNFLRGRMGALNAVLSRHYNQ